MDISKLTNEQLSELEKQIKEEKLARKDSLRVKGQLHITNERWDKEVSLLNRYIKNKGYDFDIERTIDSPMIKIQGNIFGICDYVLGNFKIAKKKSCSYPSLYCNGSVIYIDDTNQYKELYDELYSVVDKWVDIKLKEETQEVES